jgi:phage gp37-like protein
MTTTDNAIPTAAPTTDLVIPTYTPREPNAPATDGMKKLMERFEIPFRKSTTQGQASRSIHRFFVANPAVYLAYEEEKRERRKQQWAANIKEYYAIAVARSQQLLRVPSTERQISALMAAAFTRKDVPEHLAMEARQLLTYGAVSAMASTLLNQLPKRAEDAQGQQPN